MNVVSRASIAAASALSRWVSQEAELKATSSSSNHLVRTPASSERIASAGIGKAGYSLESLSEVQQDVVMFFPPLPSQPHPTTVPS